jgi:hypothetical protein
MEMKMRNWKRREWTANAADPTQVVEWKRKSGRVKIVASWGVEAWVRVCGFTWRSYDHRLFVWLYNKLEDAHNEAEMNREDDPMGPLSRYR